MEDFAVTCPLVPSLPHLISDSCSSPRAFGLGFLQTPPRDDALALLLAFGSPETWHDVSHRASSVPCPAHATRQALEMAGAKNERRLFPVACARLDFGHMALRDYPQSPSRVSS
jgi:hypothetical protein